MFMFKKIVGPLLFPVPLCLGILGFGLVLLWFTAKQRAGKILVTAGTVLVLFFSFPWASGILVEPLERKYPPLLAAPGLESSGPQGDSPIKWVVVLGGGIEPDPRLPVTSQINESSLQRVAEGVRLWRQLPGSILLLSGGSVFHAAPEADVMARIARIMGVNPREMLLETRSRDTEEQARLIKEMVGSDRFILVTSASHMPRAVALFRKHGMDPIPAPTGHLLRRGDTRPPGYFYPQSGGWHRAQIAFYEYLGLAWAWLRGKI